MLISYLCIDIDYVPVTVFHNPPSGWPVVIVVLYFLLLRIQGEM